LTRPGGRASPPQPATQKRLGALAQDSPLPNDVIRLLRVGAEENAVPLAAFLR